MLDTRITKSETKVCPVTQVVKQTITPDKVTDMYKEVREEVEKTFIRSLRVENNILKGVIVEYRVPNDDFTRRIMTRFVLNGKEHIDRSFIIPGELDTKSQLLEKLNEHYAKIVGRELLNDALTVISNTHI